MIDYEKIVTEFFKRRFPEKNLKFEKQVGYFQEWVDRFRTGNPEKWMDSESIEIYNEIKGDGWLQ